MGTLKNREEIRNEEIVLKKKVYQASLRRAYNRGRVHALKDIGYSVSEIVKTLGLKESTVRGIVNDGM